jgi:hypothetical protein
MAGRVPAIHVFWLRVLQDVEARRNAGHDEKENGAWDRFEAALKRRALLHRNFVRHVGKSPVLTGNCGVLHV